MGAWGFGYKSELEFKNKDEYPKFNEEITVATHPGEQKKELEESKSLNDISDEDLPF